MHHDALIYACVFLALWSAVIAGVFSAFSEFIMSALIRANPASGIESMQQINITVLKTQFVAGVLLIPLLSIGLAVYAWDMLSGWTRMSIALAPLVFVPAVFLVTLLGNVPMNERLARMTADSADAHTYWRRYGIVWTRFNHVRVLGSVVTAVLYLYVAIRLVQSP
ncbi:MAG: anthrone oxygenase family protein [Pseudomonadota bacterium]